MSIWKYRLLYDRFEKALKYYRRSVYTGEDTSKYDKRFEQLCDDLDEEWNNLTRHEKMEFFAQRCTESHG